MKVILGVLILLLTIPAQTEDVQPVENTKGCYLLGCSSGGNCVFDFFIKVADNEYNSEDGEPQIWGYNPQDIHKDRNGKPFYVTVLERRFIKAGSLKHLEHTACVCHCPAW